MKTEELAFEAEKQLSLSYPRGLKRQLRSLLFRVLPFPTWKGAVGRRVRRLKIWASRIYFGEVRAPFCSQYGQDIVAVHLCGAQGISTYLDIGAHDGISLSNTLVFERFGASGICVEPMPVTFNALSANRTAKCIQCAVGARDGETARFISVVGEGSMLSHLEMAAGADEKKKRIEELKVSGLADCNVSEVKIKSVQSILEESGLELVDFVSIDTEGQEIEILKACPFEKMRARVVTVECNDEDPLEIVSHMQENGFRLYAGLADDLLFVRR